MNCTRLSTNYQGQRRMVMLYGDNHTASVKVDDFDAAAPVNMDGAWW